MDNVSSQRHHVWACLISLHNLCSKENKEMKNKMLPFLVFSKLTHHEQTNPLVLSSRSRWRPVMWDNRKLTFVIIQTLFQKRLPFRNQMNIPKQTTAGWVWNILEEPPELSRTGTLETNIINAWMKLRRRHFPSRHSLQVEVFSFFSFLFFLSLPSMSFISGDWGLGDWPSPLDLKKKDSLSRVWTALT